MDHFRRVIDLTKTIEAADWSTAEQNDLPDSSFAYIEPGGEKDDEGKTTPRSKRHLPYKDANGKVDHNHAANALARLNQTQAVPDSERAAIRNKLERAVHEAGGSDTKEASEARKTIEILKVGSWNTPGHGDFEVTADDLVEYADHAAADVRPSSSTQGLPVDEDHDKGKAKAWLKNVRPSDDGQTLLADLDYTPAGRKLVESGEYKFFSPEFAPVYQDPEGKLGKIRNVLIGGGFTNRPLFKGLQSVAANDGSGDDKNEILISAAEEKEVNLADLRGKARNEVDDEGMKVLSAAKDQLTDEERAKFFPVEADDKTKEDEAAKAKAEADKKAAEEAEAAKAKEVQANEGKEVDTVTVSASEWRVMQERSKMGVEAHDKLVAKEASDHVKSLAFSEKDGFKVPSDMEKELTDFYVSASEGDKALMDKVLTNAQPILAADGSREIGQEGDNGSVDPTAALDQKAQEILANDKDNTLRGDYGAALRQAMAENPDMAKELDHAEAAKMPQVAA